MERKRLAVLISGNGTNLQAVLDACASGHLPASVAAVFSNKADAFGLERARSAGIPAIVLPKPKEEDRRQYDQRLANAVSEYLPDYVILAGWMRILSGEFLERFPERVVNLHPALPGAFPGTHAIERAYTAWKSGEIDRSGVMVHLVPNEEVDAGPVLASEEVVFKPEDTLQTFEERIHAVEHRLLVDVLQSLLR